MDQQSRRQGPCGELPDGVQQLLLAIVSDGFVVHCCGLKSDPAALVASYEWERHIDIVTIRDFTRQVIAARLLKGDHPVNIFEPDVVVWAYQGSAECTLRAVLGLVHPDHPEAPSFAFPAPAALCVPRHAQRPISIRPPTPGRAGARAARLRALMPTGPAAIPVTTTRDNNP